MGQIQGCSLDEARKAKRRATKVFEPFVSVVGIGITRIGDGYGLKVNLRNLPPSDTQLPTDVDGVPVRVEVVGLPQKQ
jgi:hypothetical protein